MYSMRLVQLPYPEMELWIGVGQVALQRSITLAGHKCPTGHEFEIPGLEQDLPVRSSDLHKFTNLHTSFLSA